MNSASVLIDSENGSSRSANGILSVLSKDPLENTSNESIDLIHYFRFLKRQYKILERNETFLLETEWQKLNDIMLEEKILNYDNFLCSKFLPNATKGFMENPFYFSDRSNSLEDNGYGDNYLYGLYAGWPQVLMIDKQGYFANQGDFLAVSVERNLSHKNSLLSSASTTQLVGKIWREMTIPVLSLLRPGDPRVRKRLLEFHESALTKKKDHNKEAMEPYTANVNFPKQLPVEIDETRKFPESLKKLGVKQHLRDLLIPEPKKKQIFQHYRFEKKQEKIFPKSRNRLDSDTSLYKGTQTIRDIFLERFKNRIRKEKKIEIDKLKGSLINFYNNKRIPLINYQWKDIHVEPDVKQKLKAFYNLHPKIETPLLTNLIKDRIFTRKYFLENFIELGNGSDGEVYSISSTTSSIIP